MNVLSKLTYNKNIKYEFYGKRKITFLYWTL